MPDSMRAPRSMPRPPPLRDREHPVTASSTSARAVWLLLSCIAAGVVALAATLEPDPAGVGTHEQLGLPPCGFLYLTGLPCPGCGLTTSFAHMARMQITSAALAHPIGVPLFMLTCLAVPYSLVACVRGAPVVHAIEAIGAPRMLLVLSAGALLTWVVRVLTIVVA